MSLGALILTGGASSRMGEDKALLEWSGVRAVDRLFALAERAGATSVFTVGGLDYGHPRIDDLIRLGGPVGGILAGADALRLAACDRALVLAVDAPTLALRDLQPLLDAPAPGAAFNGLLLPLVVSIAALPRDAESGWPVRRLIDACYLALLPPPESALRRLKGANTPAEREALLAELTGPN